MFCRIGTPRIETHNSFESVARSRDVAAQPGCEAGLVGRGSPVCSGLRLRGKHRWHDNARAPNHCMNKQGARESQSTHHLRQRWRSRSASVSIVTHFTPVYSCRPVRIDPSAMIRSTHHTLWTGCLALLLALNVQDSASWPTGAWHRLSDTPIISPLISSQGGWESAGTFNPAVVVRAGKVVMLYRAQDKRGTSRLGYAESTDGLHFTRRAQPVFSPAEAYEKDGGVEDPRLVQFGDTYYMTYTGYNKKDAQLCLATSKDLIHWQRQGVILPAYSGKWNVRWTKSGAIVPEKIDGKYWMYFLGTTADNNDQTGLVYSTDLIHWVEATNSPVLPVRADQFDSRVAEPGPAPIVTPRGIVLIYNGADDKLVYRTGIAIFDRKDPRRLIWRSDKPVFSPEKEWEKAGQVPNVVFVEGRARFGNRELFYYGGADTNVGVAEAPLIQ
jgi:beta-1,2-mannosidase